MLGNLRLKLLAVFFAVALWSVVAYASNPTQSHTYKLPITSPQLPAGLVLIGNAPQVPVTVIGTADNIQKFDPHDLVVTGNFSHAKVGTNQVPIRVENADPSVQLDAPSTVTVSVDQKASATLSVNIVRVHSLLTGVHEHPGGTSVSPSSVRVDGPKSQLNGIQAVVLVDLADMNVPGINAPYSVGIWDANKKVVTALTVTPPQVTVKMVIEADAITLTKTVGFTISGQPAAGYRVTNVTIGPLTVQATGLQNTLAGISILLTDPVDISGQKSDVIRTVTIRPPAGVDLSQKTATVHVFISPTPGVSPSASAAST